MTILDEILTNKKREVEKNKQLVPVSQLEESFYFSRQPFSLKTKLEELNAPGIIAEFKRQSPSKSIINDTAEVKEVTQAYCNAGAAGLSVLTDKKYFGGTINDLVDARTNTIPILRKDFMVDEYQIIESKSIGADVILLIAEALTKKEIIQLAQLAKSLSLDVVMEIHGKDQLAKANQWIDIIGVNNRDLISFEVDIATSIDLYPEIPDDFVKISESGINSIAGILQLYKVGFNGFLIGENFMRTKNPGAECENFILQLRK